jgi:hypothetical protein
LRAASVLGCLYLALLYSDRDVDPTWYADVAEVACRLVQDSVGRLDSVYIGPLFRRIGKANKPEGGGQKRLTDKASAGARGRSS